MAALLSCSLPPFPQQHGNPRRQTQPDTCDLGEGDPCPWEQWHGSCQVPLQPSCQGHWTQNPGGKWMCFSNKVLIGSFWVPFNFHLAWGNVWTLVLFCCCWVFSMVQWLFLRSLERLIPGFLCWGDLSRQGFVCLLTLCGKALQVPGLSSFLKLPSLISSFLFCVFLHPSTPLTVWFFSYSQMF